jgi:hypothetical protein
MGRETAHERLRLPQPLLILSSCQIHRLAILRPRHQDPKRSTQMCPQNCSFIPLCPRTRRERQVQTRPHAPTSRVKQNNHIRRRCHIVQERTHVVGSFFVQVDGGEDRNHSLAVSPQIGGCLLCGHYAEALESWRDGVEEREDGAWRLSGLGLNRWMDEIRPTKVFGIVCRPSVSRRSRWGMWVGCRG